VLLFSYYPADPRPRRAAEALVNEGMRVELICLRASEQEPSRERFNGVEILRLPLKRRRGGRFTYLFQYSAFILGAFAILASRSVRRRVNLVHVHNMPDMLVFSALVPKALGAKVVLDLHDPMPELMQTIFGLAPDSFPVRVLRRLERWSIAFADRVFTVNLACKRIFSSRSCRPDKIEVVMNSPDEAIFAFRSATPAFPQRRTPFVIMYHGVIVERNGLDVAIDALELVRSAIPDVELRVYGDETPFLERVMATVHTKGLADHVRYFGHKNLEEIVTAIDACDVGIIPNRRTMFTEINTPTRIFEYLARGKPVITGRALGVEDYFEEDTLFYFELGNAVDLARAIIHVAQHPEEAGTFVKRGQAVYLAHRWAEERQRLISTTAALLG
jgi:glycosyltransferase involved in cell wall biosynthesis